MIKIIKRGERKKEREERVKTSPQRRRLSNSTAEFNNTVTLWIEQFRRRQHSEAQRTFRSLFRES